MEDQVLDVTVLAFMMGAAMSFGGLFAFAAFDWLKKVLSGTK